jgi:hypothetical protein
MLPGKCTGCRFLLLVHLECDGFLLPREASFRIPLARLFALSRDRRSFQRPNSSLSVSFLLTGAVIFDANRTFESTPISAQWSQFRPLTVLSRQEGILRGTFPGCRSLSSSRTRWQCGGRWYEGGTKVLQVLEQLRGLAFLELGRRHFAHDFPNPTRQGCPQNDLLRLLAEQPTAVEDSVLDHITSCSPCYKTYSGFLHRMKARNSSRRSQTRSPKRPRV